MYEVELNKKAQKALVKMLDSDIFNAKSISLFLNDILATCDNPKSLKNAKKLKGYKTDVWRWRIGNYRIIGEFLKGVLVIKIIEIAHRQNVYK